MPANSSDTLAQSISKPNILFAVWEVEPFLKVGGLGEVARSLPRALKSMGVDIRLVIPHYRALKVLGQRKKLKATFSILYGSQQVKITIHKIYFLNTDIPVYLIGNKKYFDKPIAETFVVFALAVVEALKLGVFGLWKPDIVHCNDNHCGLIPLLLKTNALPIQSLLTIHGISHQRKFPPSIADKLHVPREALSLTQWESVCQQFNLLKEGIVNADWVNTVSPTYLKEIQTEEHGAGLDVVIRDHMYKTSAILNGIDYMLKNPATNSFLDVRYSAREKDSVEDASVVGITRGKQLNKKTLQGRLQLPINASIPVIGYIGRLDQRQKGIDLIHRMIVREALPDCQFVIMGQGDEGWEERFHLLRAFNPDRVAVITVYDDALASLIYAASDFMMIPSYFEPCCLIQMNAMRYGALPIARATGGLNDTVINGKNGYIFTNSSSIELEERIINALKIKSSNPKKHLKMVEAAMKRDFSWTESAKQYLALYQQIMVGHV